MKGELRSKHDFHFGMLMPHWPLIEQLRVPEVAELLTRAEQLRMSAEQAASDAGRAVGTAENGLDDQERERIARQVEHQTPTAMTLNCPACGHRWSAAAPGAPKH